MKNRSGAFLIAMVLTMLTACHYRPFVGYILNKKDFKKFSKWERLAGENSNPERDYHINRYDWEVEVFPESKNIAGEMTIHFTPKSARDVFLFDLQKRMKILEVSSSEGEVKIKRRHDLLYATFDHEIAPLTRISLTFVYEGEPANVAGEGPVQWKLDEKGRHWISTITEGIGPQFIMPCNALLGAEADSTKISVTVPKPLAAVANGHLIDEEQKETTKTYLFEVTNPINIYNISFNIGHFTKLEKPYTDINGEDRIIECQVLDFHMDTADVFYDQVGVVMQTFEEMYGTFPWWNDGCKFIESTFAAMEHQSGIAMGDEYYLDWKDYNMTLVHELAHEWWGNNITGSDYCDMWLHEGMATYSEALFIEKLYGQDDYDRKIEQMIRSVYNTIPIHKQCGVLYNSWANDADQDIYDKGALMMHSLRMVVKDDNRFLQCLYDVRHELAGQNVSSEELVSAFNKCLGKDYSALFDWYLYEAKPPILKIYVDKEEHQLYYKWDREVAFYPDGEILIDAGEGPMALTPTTTYQKADMTGMKSIDFLIEKGIYYVVEVQKKLE